jgi:formylglycine-generating enzyme required for sulfatase activity
MSANFSLSIRLATIAALITSTSADVVIDWITVGNANNAADTRPNTGYGAVDHDYKIGKYEVTNAQYVAFLNAKGQSNSNDIYNSNMSNSGITQSGDSGSYSYTVTSGFENKPVVYVSWFDAARFSNWLGNGQGSGDMETGAYTLNNATSGIISANVGAAVYIPSENEWYKAAYYKVASRSYSLYPNGQNTITQADANYDSSAATNVGTYVNDQSPYGTFDQGGNAYEWVDAVMLGTQRGLRGGAWDYWFLPLQSSYSTSFDPANDDYNIGFRVAGAVPEPTSLLLSMLASGVMLIRRKR